MNYPTITLKRVLEAIQRARGFDPTSVTLTSAEQQQYTDIVNEAGKRAWRAEFWPSLLAVGRRQFRPTYDATISYATDNEVYYQEHYYRSLSNANIGNTPAAGSAYWSQDPDDMIYYIEFEQYWETDKIEAVHFPTCATEDNPLTTPNAKLITGIRQWERTILFTETSDLPKRPYIRYRTPWPEQSAVAWAVGTAYTAGERVYRATTGYTYVAIAATTGATPEDAGSAAIWVPVGFPEMFLEYVRLYAKSELAADDEGKFKSRAQAEDELDNLRELHLPQSGQPGRVNWRGR